MKLRPVRCSSRDDWLARRRLGASDVARVLGRSPYGGPFGVWARLVGLDVARRMPAYVERGLKWEPVIRAAYQVETGRECRAPRPWTMYVGPEEWATVTPDGFVHDDAWGPSELKLAFEFGLDWPPSGTIERWTPGALPRRDWYLQAHQHCWALEAPWTELVVLLPTGHELRVYRVMQDPCLVRRLVPQLRAWWGRHVVRREPVAVDTWQQATQIAALQAGRPDRGRFGRRHATAAEQDLAMQLELARQAGRMAYETTQALQAQLFASAGRASALTFTRGGQRWTASIVREPAPHVRVHRRMT